MAHQPRVGFNDKARGSVAGGKKKGKRTKASPAGPSVAPDPNVVIYVPKSSEVKELERKERVKQEVCR